MNPDISEGRKKKGLEICFPSSSSVLSSKLRIIYSTTILMAKRQKARQSCFEVEQWKYVVLTQPRDMRDVLFNINGTVILLFYLIIRRDPDPIRNRSSLFTNAPPDVEYLGRGTYYNGE